MKVEKYKCINTFNISKLNDDRKLTNKTICIKKGSLWNKNKSDYPEMIRLERWFIYNDGKMICHWMDIDEKLFKSNFIKEYRYE